MRRAYTVVVLVLALIVALLLMHAADARTPEPSRWITPTTYCGDICRGA